MANSSREKRILGFIREYSKAKGESPSFREIQQYLGVSSLSTVHYYINKLIDKGELVNRDGFHGKRSLEVISSGSRAVQNLPLLGRIAAGTPIEAVENAEQISVPDRLYHPENYVLQVMGDSMIEDGVLDGDLVVVRHTRSAERRQMVVALLDGEATLKRYVPTDQGIELHPANPDYPVIRVGSDQQFEIRGRAIGVMRQY